MHAKDEAMLEELRERARKLGEENEHRLEGLDEETTARKALEALAGAELLGWAVPEAHGGAPTGELSPNELVSVRALSTLRDELAYHHGMLDLMLVMQGLGSCAVVLGGSDELRADVLPGVARGGGFG